MIACRGGPGCAALVLAALSGCATWRAGPAAAPASSVRVVSYNIRHGRGMDDTVNLARTAAVLRRLRPDIVALQEVDSSVARSGGLAEAEVLGGLLGLRPVFGGFFAYQGGQYGMAILSRFPVVAVHPVRLPDGNEPRIALAVELQLPGGRRVMVVSVHFDWVDNDSFRLRQAGALARWLDDVTMPVMVVGDFNDVPGSRTLALFDDRFRAALKPADDRFTFSSTEPVKEIDHVYLAPAMSWAVLSTIVVVEPLASDHRPLLAVIMLR